MKESKWKIEFEHLCIRYFSVGSLRSFSGGQKAQFLFLEGDLVAVEVYDVLGKKIMQ